MDEYDVQADDEWSPQPHQVDLSWSDQLYDYDEEEA